jgi:hypothetical protein
VRELAPAFESGGKPPHSKYQGKPRPKSDYPDPAGAAYPGSGAEIRSKAPLKQTGYNGPILSFIIYHL